MSPKCQERKVIYNIINKFSIIKQPGHLGKYFDGPVLISGKEGTAINCKSSFN